LGVASGKSLQASESVTLSRGVEVFESMQSQTCFWGGSGSGFRVSGVRCRISGFRFRVPSDGCQVSRFSVRICVFGVRPGRACPPRPLPSEAGTTKKGLRTFTESQDQNPALTVLSVPYSLDSSPEPPRNVQTERILAKPGFRLSPAFEFQGRPAPHPCTFPPPRQRTTRPPRNTLTPNP